MSELILEMVTPAKREGSIFPAEEIEAQKGRHRMVWVENCDATAPSVWNVEIRAPPSLLFWDLCSGCMLGEFLPSF